MYKFSIIIVFAFTGCSYFTFNASMCDQIASDPHATVPKECRNYVEEDAEKAFNNTFNKTEDNESITFSKDEK